jgi:hypothetical protein
VLFRSSAASPRRMLWAKREREGCGWLRSAMRAGMHRRGVQAMYATGGGDRCGKWCRRRRGALRGQCKVEWVVVRDTSLSVLVAGGAGQCVGGLASHAVHTAERVTEGIYGGAH